MTYTNLEPANLASHERDLHIRVLDAVRAQLGASGLTLTMTSDVDGLADARRRIADGYVFPCLDPQQMVIAEEHRFLSVVVSNRDGTPIAAIGARLYVQTSLRSLLESGRLWGGEPQAVKIDPATSAVDSFHDRLAFLGGLAVDESHRGARIGQEITMVLRSGVLAAWAPTILFALHQTDKGDLGLVRGYFQYRHDSCCTYAAFGGDGQPRHHREILGWVFRDEVTAISSGRLRAKTQASVRDFSRERHAGLRNSM